MAIENGQWIMRGLRWDDPFRIRSWQELIRWIDDKNRCHDNETDSEEYVTRGEKYWDRAEEYKAQLNLSADSTSAS